MNEKIVFALTLTSIMGSGLMGGVFFAFSSFVMPALKRIPPAEGIRAMQRINIDVFHWSFIGLFFGTPIAAVVLAAPALWNWPEPGAILATLGSAVYLVGCLLVTGMCNVPRNNALAGMDADKPDAVRAWNTYSIEWTRWNHVRTAACIAAAGAFLASLLVN